MNAPFPAPKAIRRHRFTLDDVLDMTASGLLPKHSVLLDGQVYDMGSDGVLHIEFAMRLGRRIGRILDEGKYFVGIQTTLRLSKFNGPSPDIYVLAGGAGPEEGDVPPERILLVIEVADASLDDNLTDSASRYARHAVRDYWVVDVKRRVIHVHRDPKDGAYPPPRVIESSAQLRALLIPELALALDAVVPA
jgi:Uma2 family endonuclease